VGLLVLVLLFGIFVALIIVFSHQLIYNLSQVDFSAHILIILVAVAFPLVLLGVIVYQIVRLIRERTFHLPGARFKTRLLLFFALIALFSSVPQAMLSISFINSTIDFWLEARIGEALKGGMEISLDYYQDKLETLKSFGRSPQLGSLLRGALENPEQVWRNIQSVNSEIDFIQVFDGGGKEIFFQGNPEGRIQDFGALREPGGTLPSGSLPKEDRASLSIMRYLAQSRIAGQVVHVLSGIVLLEGFDANARRITESLEAFNQLGRYRQLFRLVILIFYFFFSLPIFLLTILVSFLLADEIIQPIVNLEEATRRVAEGDFSFRILSRSGDELEGLVSSFNRMIGELGSSRKKLLQAEKISAWQDIAQRLAHEIKNPLTPIQLSAQRILKKFHSNREEFDRILEPAISAIIDEVESLDRLLVEFREFARLPGPRPEPTCLRELVGEVASMYAHLSGEARLDVSRIDPAIHLAVDRSQMKQVFANLFRNAIQAMPRGGEVTVWADLIRKESIEYCRIWIRDTGEGIEEEIRGKIFEPYFTTKKGGTGLGLAIVERVIFDHNGTIGFETQKGTGTTFIIDLPLER
jgi:nitrogen fixation/metabolism regulation signal transduction histidine kinase